MAVYSLKSKEALSNLTAPANIDLGGMIPISTVSVGSGGQANIEFTSIPQNYEHLQIRGLARITNVVSSSDAEMRFNGDSGANYAHHHLYGNGSAASTPGTGTTTARIYPSWGGMPGANVATNSYSGFILDVLDYTNTNKYTTIRSLWGYDSNGGGEISFNSGVWMNTAAITSISFMQVTFAQYSHLALYGIKRAGV